MCAPKSGGQCIISFVVFLNNHLINSSQRATNWTPWLVVGPPGLKLQATFFGAPNLPNSNAFYFLYHKLYKFAILRHMKWLGFLWYHSNHIPTNNKEKKAAWALTTVILLLNTVIHPWCFTFHRIPIKNDKKMWEQTFKQILVGVKNKMAGGVHHYHHDDCAVHWLFSKEGGARYNGVGQPLGTR